jgi:hypothetical protein
MATLFERMFPEGIEIEKIPVHYLRSALGEYTRGKITLAEIVSHWTLDAATEKELKFLTDKLDGLTKTEQAEFLVELHDVFMLAEAGIKAKNQTDFDKRLDLKP